jgi:hypothetical protein
MLLNLITFGSLILAPFHLAHSINEERSLLANDKEVVIRAFSKKEVKRIQQHYTESDEPLRMQLALYQSVKTLRAQPHRHCDFRLIELFQDRLARLNLKPDQDHLEEALKVLRVNHAIDDLFYRLLSEANEDYHALERIAPRKKRRTLIAPKVKKLLATNDLAELYEDFQEWPDETTTCAYSAYYRLKKSVRNGDDEPSKKTRHLEALNRRALREEIIDLETFNKLEYLRTKSKVNKRRIWLSDYFHTTFNAKNKLIPLSYEYTPVDLDDENDFASKKLRRFSKLTRRELLYRKYDATQMIMLAQVIQKAARRMGVDPDTESLGSYITKEYSVLQSNGERKTYVERIDLDPQSQFNLARRMMRKDIIDLQMMDSFTGLKITYSDVVMAAFETGYVSFEDLEHVLAYDDLWNPQKTKFERVSGFIFRLTGYGTFLLPTPWNITASIALGIVEGLVDNKNRTGANNDNPGTIIN